VRSALQANSPAVLVIIVLNVMIWIGQFFVPQLTQMFASHSPSIAQGQWWRLLTPMFLHAPFTGSIFSLMHIGFNMYILRVFGPNVEESFKTSRFVPMYLAAGFAGSAASYAFGSCFGLGVGASGAIFGVVGILLAYMYNRRTSTFVSDAMRNLLFFVGLNLFIGFTIPIIDNAAHIGGLVAGLVLGYGMDPGAGRAPSLPRQIITLVLVVGATLLLVMWKTANFAC
jgi:rhomboid protease GluP